LIKSSLNAWSAGVQQLSCSGCFAAAGSGAKATMPMAESSIRLLRCDRAIRRPRAGAPGQVAQAVQPPASLVAVASACLQAVQANAKCMQALCRLARCLTIQSTGHAPASWVMPVISNVERLHSAFTLAHASQRCFVHRTGRALRLLPACSSSLSSQLVSRRGRPARSAACRQSFALKAHAG